MLIVFQCSQSVNGKVQFLGRAWKIYFETGVKVKEDLCLKIVIENISGNVDESSGFHGMMHQMYYW